MNTLSLRASAILLPLASISLSSFALAQPGGGPGGGGPWGNPFGGPEQKLVEKFDLDKNGWLNTQERQAAREFLSKTPQAGGRGGAPGGRFAPPSLAGPLIKALDANNDSQVSAQELEAGLKTFFTKADSANAESLDRETLADALTAIIPAPPGLDRPPQNDGGRRGQRFGPGMFLGPALFERGDASKDGKLTLDEMKTFALASFKEADEDKSGKLSETELDKVLASLAPARGPGGGGPGGGPGGRNMRDPAKPGAKVAPDQAQSFPKASLYEPTVLRTLFIEFENKADWEEEMAQFKNSDVEIAATMIVDGKTYTNVGVSFRGASSFGMVPAGYKRSLNIAMDMADSKQRLYGYKSLNLLNGNGDASMLSTILYSHIANQFLPAPKANLVKVVINGESWGIYANVQQFNKEFIAEHFKATKGDARWKVPGRPNGNGGLEYLGENIADYKARYEIKSKDDDKDWKALIKLCRVLNETPADQLEAALKPMLDVDGLLWFLAIDVGLINSDGYWTRASDYSIYLDGNGMFHIIPHDMNESFHGAGGPGMGGPGGSGGRGGPGGPGAAEGGERGGAGSRSAVGLDPLVALTDARKPLRSKILAVPALRERYLRCVKTIAEQSLDWNRLGPVVAQYRTLVEKEIASDTRKLSTTEAFMQATSPQAAALNLRAFADQRRAFLLEHAEIRKLP